MAPSVPAWIRPGETVFLVYSPLFSPVFLAVFRNVFPSVFLFVLPEVLPGMHRMSILICVSDPLYVPPDVHLDVHQEGFRDGFPFGHTGGCVYVPFPPKGNRPGRSVAGPAVGEVAGGGPRAGPASVPRWPAASGPGGRSAPAGAGSLGSGTACCGSRLASVPREQPRRGCRAGRVIFQ
jgi:hypothetical protein